ncbi:Peptidyl-prolyl cis-trans isomerase D [Rubripirellula tenax]|uniref:Periplasmic chaperone PpiD n=1 Tax=Rubripirellula tenax TaxID=2528015 RepID=A0A5C6FK58_9BACT|nr:peptidylprolyl isomerase [Rubripirellula tenax]TWU60052.1 Peptidyl-prolyl cis-trans isomerase D [Rubripirellula tenax]
MSPRQFLLVLFVSVASTVSAQGTGAQAPGAGGGANMELPEDPAAIIAVVGQTPILLGDLMPRIDAKIAEVSEKTGQEIPEEYVKAAKVNMMRPLLASAIQNKMMREAFLIDQVGTQAADKRAEADATLTSKARMMFFESEYPELAKQYKTEDRAELDRLLREKGTSLASRQREFVDQMLGHLYIRSKVDREPKVSIAEINEYYQTNREAFYKPTRARWEQMSVMFDRYPSREEAKQAIWEMGREAYFGGNLQAVAREKSQEPFASQGGLHDWTTKGSLASTKLEDQIFSIPTNAMSEVIEDDDGYHIIRVLDREEAGVVTLSEVQDEIRGKIREEKISKSQRDVLESMQHRIAIWSIFPDDVPGAQPLPIRVARLQ